jgi:hypothetical protein
VDDSPQRPSPFASLEVSSRERLLAETAEAWYHFGDSVDVQDLIARVDDSLAAGGRELAAALIFAVLSSDDTHLGHALGESSQSG